MLGCGDGEEEERYWRGGVVYADPVPQPVENVRLVATSDGRWIPVPHPVHVVGHGDRRADGVHYQVEPHRLRELAHYESGR